MQTIETFNREMIRRYLEERNVNFLTDRDGDFVVFFETEPGLPDLMVHFMVGGLFEEILSVRAKLMPTPPLNGEVCLNLVNNWNVERRWPKAVYRQGEIGLEWDIDLERGVHYPLLAHLCDILMVATHQFLTEIPQLLRNA